MVRQVEVSYHFPTLHPPEEKGSGEWRRAAVKVGKVAPDGRIENTPFRFKKRTVKGGVAYTRNQVLVSLPGGDKVNVATGERFAPTRKTRKRTRKAYWGSRSRTYVPPSYLEEKRNVQS